MSTALSKSIICSQLLKTVGAVDEAAKMGRNLVGLNSESKIDRVFFIASGGSFSTVQLVTWWGSYECQTIEFYAVDAETFESRTPPRLQDSSSLCVFLSTSGKTRSVLNAIGSIKKRNCIRLAITQEEMSPLAKACDNVLTTGRIEAVLAKISHVALGMVCFALLGGLMEASDGWEHLADLINGLRVLPQLADDAVSKFQKKATIWAKTYKLKSRYAIVGPGFKKYHASILSHCVGKEVIKVDCEPLSEIDVLHGACETIEKYDVLLSLKGDDPVTDSANRFYTFAEKHHQTVLTIETYIPEYEDLHGMTRHVLGSFIGFLKSVFLLVKLGEENGQDMTRMTHYGRV